MHNKYAIQLINIKIRSSAKTYKSAYLAYTVMGDVQLTNNLNYAVRGNDKQALIDKITDLPNKYQQLFEVVEVEE